MEEKTTTINTLITKFGFTDSDFEQIKEMNIDLDKIESELLIFKSGIPKVFLEKPATIGDGILKISNPDFEEFAKFFDIKKKI